MTLKKQYLDLLLYANDPIRFMEDILGLELKDFHKEWIELFEKNKFVVLLAPRGFGKTTIVGGYIIWRIVRDPDIRILIVTINQNKANEMMTFIQHHLEKNEKLIEVFGEQKGTGEWSRNQLRVKRQGMTGVAHKEPTLEVLGVESKMISGHYDLIVLDDITDLQNSRTEHRRRELQDWYSHILLPMLLPDGQIIDIGTRFHQNDIHGFLMSKPSYVSKVYKAIINEKEKKVLWPERFPYEKLVEIREQIGKSVFAMQFQNEFITSEDAIIKYEWIRYYDEPPQGLRRFMGVDMSAGGEKGDYFVIMIIGVSETGDIYVLDMLRTKATLFRQFDLIKEMAEKWEPIRIGIEANAMQKLFTDELIRSTTLPIKPIKSAIDKISRVEQMSILFETGRVFLPTNGFEALIDELSMFPKAKYDDCVDALSFAILASRQNSSYDWREALQIISLNKTVGKVQKI